jgi:hypothetical protein
MCLPSAMCAPLPILLRDKNFGAVLLSLHSGRHIGLPLRRFGVIAFFIPKRLVAIPAPPHRKQAEQSAVVVFRDHGDRVPK